jgi:formylmethanofuran dehydrogenase subunit E
MQDIQALLQLSQARHNHLCPRQVLGVRMALAGASALHLDLPRQDKRLLVIAETDGCFIDGLEVAGGVAPGHRTLRIEDCGKVAASFVDTITGDAVRLAPLPGIRQDAAEFAPEETGLYLAQVNGYQVMPDESMFSILSVVLKTPIEAIVSRPGVRVNCSLCGEEIINERELHRQGRVVCRTCAGQGYYHQKGSPFFALSEVEGTSTHQ